MEILPILTKWAKVINQANEAADNLNAVGMSPEAPILEALWAATEALTHAVETRLGIASPGWLDWYACENHVGKDGKEAGYGDDLRKIKTLEDLAWLVEMELAKTGE
ncbi:hypothetical protein K0U83_07060 [bacterium]|nr:hypothetical protein [bacterium]